MGKFLVKNAANGFKFGLIVANDEIILNSEIYSSEAACLAGIESVKKNALIAKLEDQTVEGYKVLSNPKYEIFKDKKDMLRFHLKARNGEIIAASESYAKMESCLRGIEIIRKYALDARIVKET